jgi:hypothetical protein
MRVNLAGFQNVLKIIGQQIVKDHQKNNDENLVFFVVS